MAAIPSNGFTIDDVIFPVRVSTSKQGETGAELNWEKAAAQIRALRSHIERCIEVGRTSADQAEGCHYAWRPMARQDGGKVA